MDEPESDEKLVARYHHVKMLVEEVHKQRDRMKPGGARDRKSRWGGSLNFTLLQIEMEMEQRGLKP